MNTCASCEMNLTKSKYSIDKSSKSTIHYLGDEWLFKDQSRSLWQENQPAATTVVTYNGKRILAKISAATVIPYFASIVDNKSKGK